ncbi:hscarg protein [Lipomyces mesembrius]
MTPTKPIIVVTGATGAQGGSVLCALQATERFSLRAVTRNLQAEAAQALARSGVELVEGDATDEQSMERAFAGAWGAYFVTNFWDPAAGLAHDTDLVQGKIMVNAVVAASRLALTRLCIRGLLCNQLDKRPPRWTPQREKDGLIVIRTPIRADVALPVVDLDADFGKFVAPAFLDPAKFHYKKILAVAEYVTVGQMAAAYTDVTGANIAIVPIPIEDQPNAGLRRRQSSLTSTGTTPESTSSRLVCFIETTLT